MLGVCSPIAGVTPAFADSVATASAPASAAPAAPSTAKKSAAPKKSNGVRKLTMADLAPADEYFGPMKLSILGIRNTIRDLGFKYMADPSKADSTIASAAFCEAALREWQKKYPLDTQLPRNIYFLEHLYAEITTDAGAKKTIATETWLFTAFPSSPQARQLHRELDAAKNASPTPAPIEFVPSPSPGPAYQAPAPTGQNNIVPLNGGASPAPASPGPVTGQK